MATHLVRFLADDGQARWGVLAPGGVVPLAGTYPTTAALIEQGADDWRDVASGGEPGLRLETLTPLSPVTAPCRVLCQGVNYRQHMIESGVDPDAKTFNMFFEKSDCSISPPHGVVQRPAHVVLLDYEIELALVLRRPVTAEVQVTAGNLHEYVFGLTIANDLSARDVQIPETQFFKGKSYRGFCPLGPVLCVPEPDEFHCLDELNLTLAVNGEVRQHDTTGNLVYKPAETITELSSFSDISPGDVLLTGTPAGCALRVPPPFVRKLLQLLLPERRFWSTFVRTQCRNGRYLQPGDVVTASIASADRRIDLGEQRIRIA